MSGVVKKQRYCEKGKMDVDFQIHSTRAFFRIQVHESSKHPSFVIGEKGAYVSGPLVSQDLCQSQSRFLEACRYPRPYRRKPQVGTPLTRLAILPLSIG